MKTAHIATLSIMLGAFALAGCNSAQEQQAQAIVAGICAGAQVAAITVAADGTILGASANTQTKVTAGQQLVTVNCAATQAGITAVVAAMNASPTALVSVENDMSSKTHIPVATLDKIVKHYAGK